MVLEEVREQQKEDISRIEWLRNGIKKTWF